MPKLVIDNREIHVAEGTKVIEAAEKLGIMIPRFCFHPALGSVGACRVCAVKFEEGPVKGIEMSCMVEARDGMRVSTHDADAVDFRRQVLEWLMLNHPHDCPVCDEGGQCLLQDMTVSSGHSMRSYMGKKRTHTDQDLGPLVQHEMNRCIQCYRCVRFYREYMGYQDLGVMGIGSRVYFGRRRSGTLKSPFSGNLIDICPTGVFTDKPSRFAGRRWDFTRQPSICIHCGLGCHVTTSVHLRKVVRQEARFSPRINGHFICDRGRYGFGYGNRHDRPLKGRADNYETSWKEALAAAEKMLTAIVQKHGSSALALVGSHRTAMETLLALKHLCREKQWSDPVFWKDRHQADVLNEMAYHYDHNRVSDPMDLAEADMILTIGVDPLNQAPMLAPAMRRAAKAGCRIFIAHPGPLSLPFEFDHLIESPAKFDGLLRSILQIVRQSGEPDPVENADANAQETSRAAEIARLIGLSKKPVIVVGSDPAGLQTIGLVSELVSELTKARETFAEQGPVGLMMVVPGANALGAALIDEGGNDFCAVLDRIEAGQVKALVLVEHDPLWDFPDRSRLEKALENLDCLIVFDYINSDAARLATVLIPTRPVFEAGGTFINHAGRVQKLAPIFPGGLPVSRTGNGGHPPRQFSRLIPGADIPSARQALWHLSFTDNHLEPAEIDRRLWQGQAKSGKPLDIGNLLNGRIKRIDSGKNPKPDDHEQWIIPPDAFRLLLTESVFGSEMLSSYSEPLQQMTPSPKLHMSAADAEVMDLTSGDSLSIQLNGATLKVSVDVSSNIAGGFLALAMSRNTNWQIFDSRSPILEKKHLQYQRKGDG